MTQPALPSGGGSYIIDQDGTLTPLEQPVAAHDPTTDAPASIPDAEELVKPKPARRSEPQPDPQPDLKEA